MIIVYSDFFSPKSDRNIYYNDMFSQRIPRTDCKVLLENNALHNRLNQPPTNSSLWTGVAVRVCACVCVSVCVGDVADFPTLPGMFARKADRN